MLKTILLVDISGSDGAFLRNDGALCCDKRKIQDEFENSAYYSMI